MCEEHEDHSKERRSPDKSDDGGVSQKKPVKRNSYWGPGSVLGFGGLALLRSIANKTPNAPDIVPVNSGYHHISERTDPRTVPVEIFKPSTTNQKSFLIDGKEYHALNHKNALRKAKKDGKL